MRTTNTDLLERHEKIADTLTYQWKVDDGVFALQLANATIEMGMENGLDHVVQPNRWLRRTHSDQTIHEPGLVTWMLVLAERFRDKNIRFVDAGSLFGYFSFMADRLFESCSAIAVEANPESAGYIERTIERFNYERVSVANCLLSDRVESGNVRYVDGFTFGEDPPSDPPDDAAPNRRQRQVVVDERLLVDFLDLSGDSLNILKVDAEGHQADFLPPATPELINSRSIVLMEFDDEPRMTEFDSSNAELCQPFLDADYALFWGIHRDLTRPFQVEREVRPEMEQNYPIDSLAVLVPKELTS